jgi:hypothetical protein
MVPPRQQLWHTPERFFSATDLTTETDFHTHVLQAIRSASNHEEIIYSQVPPAWGSSVFKYLDEHTSARLDESIHGLELY